MANSGRPEQDSSLIEAVRDALFYGRNDPLTSLPAYVREPAIAALDEIERREKALRDLVVRFRQWDDLPARADGPYWMREADRVLGDG